jgi:hypothetical protein
VRLGCEKCGAIVRDICRQAMARGGWPVKLAPVLLACWSPWRSRKMTVRIGEEARVDAERAHVGWCGQRAAVGLASRSNSSTSVCDAADIPRLNSVQLAARGTTW